MNATILLVEDNPHHMKINKEVLSSEGYRIIEAETLEKGRELFLKERPNLIVLDVMLPDGNGLNLCEELRRGSQVPILFLSAKKADDDVVAGFKAGGDDYLTKPFNFGVLVNRVEAILRRHNQVPELLTKGSLTLDVYAKKVKSGGNDLDIKGKEFDVLLLLWQNENKHLTAESIYGKVWSQPMLGEDATLKSTISRLRKKLKGTVYTITSTRNEGYCFEKGSDL